MDYCLTAGGVTIENNLIYNNEGWCIIVLNSNGAVIRNNICYHNGIRPGSGEISSIGNNLTIFNNILAPRQSQVALNIRLARSDFTVDPATVSEGNDLLDVPATAVAVLWGDSQGTVSQFQSRNGRGWGVGSLAADPRFVDEFGFNFHLQNSSPAIDKGNTARAPSIDFDGQPRPAGTAADIGAFEFASDSTPLPAPTNLRVIKITP
jgi:parallel beta-helix repeat protein